MKAIEVLIAHGVPETRIVFLNLVASPEGLAAMYATYPKVKVITAWVDEGLNEQKYIVPGLGDFGDRFVVEPPLAGFGLDLGGLMRTWTGTLRAIKEEEGGGLQKRERVFSFTRCIITWAYLSVHRASTLQKHGSILS